MESGINRVSIAKTIRIPPKHNGAISVSIKGHDIKTPTACFIGSQYTNPEVKLIDGVHDISHNVTLQVLVINNSYEHVNFLKGMKIGHLEPLIDDLTQIPINSATTQRMLPETVKPDSFTPPKYQLDATIQQQLDSLLRTFQDQFAKDEMTIGTTPLTQMSIDTGNSDPVSQKPYPVAMKHYNWVKEEINKLLEAGVIKNSHSSWSAPIIVVLKGDGGKHLVIDYRALNKVMRKFVWPMPKVEDIFSQLNGAKYFSTLDLRAGYHHIRLTADSILKTAFTSLFGKYEYVKVPFGLVQAPAYFQELMTGALKDLPFAMAYLDDIIIYSSTPEEHLQHIKTVFEKLCHAKLSMKLNTQRRWSTPEQEAYGIYFTIKKWNYYLQGPDIIVRNDHKPLAWFLNGKNKNMKINRWGLELASYNITFEWISGVKNKTADCLSRLEELPEKHQKNPNGTKPVLINMVKAVTTTSGMKKTPTVKKTEKQPPLGTTLNKDNTPRTVVSKETTNNSCEDNPKDTSIKEMQSTDPF